MNPYDDTSPSQDEVGRLIEPLDRRVLAIARDVTEPEPDAVARLVASRPARRRIAPVWVGALAIAAMTLVIWRVGQGTPDEITTEVVASGPREIAPGVVMAGVADVAVTRADVHVVEVAMRRGTARFQAGAPRLGVTIGDVRVEAREVDVEITVLLPNIQVDVHRGHASATAGGHTWALSEGERWTWPIDHAAAVTPTAGPPTAGPPTAGPPTAVAAADVPGTGVPPTGLPAPGEIAAIRVASEGARSGVHLVENPVPPVVHAGSSPASGFAAAFAAILDRTDRRDPPGVLVTAWDEFLKSYPDAPPAVTEEAIANRLLVVLDYLPPKRAMAEADRWIAAHPDAAAPHRAEILERAARITKDDLKDCERALPLYEALRASTTGQTRARADGWIGLCNIGLGHRDIAEPALRRALAGGVAPPLLDEVVQALTQ